MQISLFDGSKKFENNKPIRLIELFAGIGSQAQALKELGVDFKHHKIVEFDKYAIKSYNAIHNTSFEVQDITKINADELEIIEADKYNYIMTYSFPCQDLSLAGQGAGMAKGSGTRSGLLWEVERLLLETKQKPQILLMENVPEVIGTKNMPHFAEWIKALEKMGYKNYWENLKATDFGIPQSRNRTFMISIQGDYYYSFPKPIKLGFLLKDMLENEVEEKYYLSDKMIDFFKSNEIKNIEKGNGFRFNVTDGNSIAKTITTRNGSRMDDNFIKTPNYNIKSNNKRLHSMLSKININKTQVIDMYNQKMLDNMNTIKTTIDKSNMTAVHHNLRIRKLTPKECWRLMGFRDELFYKAEAVNLNAQLYKQAGNSIVTTVLMAIFGELLGVDWKSKINNLINELKEQK